MTKNTNKKWLELEALQTRQAEHNVAHGNDATDLSKKIIELKQDIQRQALNVEDEVADVALKNRAEIVRLMLEYGITIPAKDFTNWRATQRSKGEIPGVWDYVEIILTDGILGYFLNGDEVVIGHIQKFGGTVKPLFSTTPKRVSTPRPRKTKEPRQPMSASAALDLIAQMTQ